MDPKGVDKQLEAAFQLKKEFPDMITGFDLVADEAAGNSIYSFRESWMKLNDLSKNTA